MVLCESKSLRSLAVCLAIVFCLCARAHAVYVETIRVYFINGDYKTCIAEGEKIIAQARSKKGLDELYYMLGLSYLKTGNHLRASDIFEIIRSEYKDSRFREEASLGLGDSYFLRGDYRKAQQVYRDLLKVAPKTKLKAGVYARLSQLGSRTNDRQQENEYREKLRTEFPKSPEALTAQRLFPLTQPQASPAMTPETKEKPARPALAVSRQTDYDVVLPGQYSVQVGAFSSRLNAARLKNSLQAQGHSAFVIEGFADSKRIYKVRVGMFSALAQAQRAEKELRLQGYPTKLFP